VIERRLGFPLVVKPASQGSALGVKLAGSAEAVPAALVAAFSYDRKVLLERYVDGREFAVSILQSADGRTAEALPVLEAVKGADDHDFFAARYEIGRTTFICPADLPDAVAGEAQELALSVYDLMGCYGLARVDMMRDAETGGFEVLELNVIPGLTETSLLPQAADAAGISFDALIARILDSAAARP
jgi:D-alanine-D-alanine ligase